MRAGAGLEAGMCRPVSAGPGQPRPSSKSSHVSGTGMCEVPSCVPEMHSESGVKLQGTCTGGNVCCMLGSHWVRTPVCIP